MAAKIFTVPFASGGDVTAIPDAVQSDGSLSYTSGYGPDYERQLGVDPLAKNISRASFNAALNDITVAIQALQAGTVLPWNQALVTALGGLPIGALVAATTAANGYWQNTVAGNTTNPEGASPAGWTSISGLAIAAKAPLNSPPFTGNPTAPTPAVGDNDTSLATTAFVQAALAAFGIGTTAGPVATDANAITAGGLYSFNNPTASANLPAAVNGMLIHMPWTNTAAASQIFITTATGTGQMWFRSATTNSWQAWKQVAGVASPALTGLPTAPTPAVGDNTTTLATTAFVQAALAAFGIGTATATALTDLNAATKGGFYYALSTASNLPVAANGSLIHVPFNGTSAALQIYSTLVSPTRIFYRTLASGTWTSWNEFSMLASPALTGTPTAPTAAAGTNNTQVATTAFAAAAIAAAIAAIPVATGRLLGITVISATGVYTPSSSSVRMVRITAVGGGAAGGSAQATSSGSVAGAGGGGSGGVAQSLVLASTVSGLTATIGTAGSPSSSGAGGNGGATTFGGITANGGGGGALVGSLTPPQGGLGGSGGTASGGNVFNMRGGNGMHGQAAGTGYVLSGSGGSNPYGGGGPGNLLSTATQVAGTAGQGFGAGGGGGASNSGGSTALGASGNTGVVIIEEFT